MKLSENEAVNIINQCPEYWIGTFKVALEYYHTYNDPIKIKMYTDEFGVTIFLQTLQRDRTSDIDSAKRDLNSIGLK